MRDDLYRISERSIYGEETSIVFRVMIAIMMILSLFSAATAAKMSPLFVGMIFICIIIGSLASYFTVIKKIKWLKILLSYLMTAILFFCSCTSCKQEYMLNIKFLILHILLVLSVMHIFNCPKRENLRLAAFLSMVIVGLSVNADLDTYWGIFLFVYLLVTMCVFFYDNLLSNGYVPGNINTIIRDFDYLRMVKKFLFVFLIGFIVFCFVPRIQLIPDNGFTITQNIDYDDGYLVSLEKDYTAKGNRGGWFSGGSSSGGSGKGRSGKGSGRSNSGLGDLLGKLMGLFGGNGPSSSSKDKSPSGNSSSSLEKDMKNKDKNNDNEDIIVFKYKTTVNNYYLRELAFDEYSDSSWKMSNPDDYNILEYFDEKISIPPEEKEPLVSAYLDVNQQIQIENMKSNLIVSSYRPDQIVFPKDMVMFDYNENLRSPVLMKEGFRYIVSVSVPVVSSDVLLSQDSIEEEIIKNSYPEKIYKYLQLPDTITQRTIDLANKIAKNGKNDYDKALRLREYLVNEYKYDKELDNFPKNAEAIDYFLFESKQGYIEDYASSLAVMLRTQNIPSRFVTGYSSGVMNPFSNFYEVRPRDTEYWVEAYIPDCGWVPLYKSEPEKEDLPFIFLLLFYLISLLMQFKFLIPILLFLKHLLMLILQNLPLIMFLIVDLIILGAIIFIALKLLNITGQKNLDEPAALYVSLCNKLKRYGFEKKEEETALDFLDRVKSIKSLTPQDERKLWLSNNIEKIEQVTVLYLEIRFGKAEDKIFDLRKEVSEVLAAI